MNLYDLMFIGRKFLITMQQHLVSSVISFKKLMDILHFTDLIDYLVDNKVCKDFDK
jgi:hypothetical protein